MARQPISRSVPRTATAAALAVIAAVASPLAGCGEAETAAPETTPAPTTPPTRLIVVAAPTTTLRPIDPERIQDCVDYVQFGVYTGNGLAEQMWENASRDLELLVVDCESLGRTDPLGFAEISRQWRDIEAFLEGATADLPADDSTP